MSITKAGAKEAQGLCGFIVNYSRNQGLDASAGISADGKRLRIVVEGKMLEIPITSAAADAGKVQAFIRKCKVDKANDVKLTPPNVKAKFDDLTSKLRA